MKRTFTALGCALLSLLVAGAAPAQTGDPGSANQAPASTSAQGTAGELTMEQAVYTALERNHDVIAARLDIDEAEYDRVAARVYPNPVLSYQAGNIVLGHGSPYNVQSGASAHPGPFSQLVHSVGISEIIDVWAKRSARMRAADEGVRFRRLQVEDALREIVYAVRSQFADVLRVQSARQFAREVRDRYADTVRLSRARFRTGEISEAEFRKIELEGLKYQDAVIDADTDYEIARQKLAALLGFGSASEIPTALTSYQPPGFSESLAVLTQQALAARPDLRAAAQEGRYAKATRASAEREAYPDLNLGVTYTHSNFGVSGDNPNTLAVSASVPLPLFDRNQANIGRAEVAIRRAKNDLGRLVLQVRHEVAEAQSRSHRATALLALYEAGGMLDRAETSLRVAENSYRAGAISLLELLEAQRTYLETRADYLRALYDRQQSAVDLIHALGVSPANRSRAAE